MKKAKKWFRHLFTPHHTNNHRPRALHPKAFISYILFFIVLQISFSTINVVRPDILGITTNITVEKLWQLTNQERRENGLPPLSLNPTLSRAAYLKAQDMFAKDYWAHNAPDGATPWDFILQAGYHYLFAGENLARDFTDSKGVVEAWMNSPSHKENILRPQYRDIGFAVVNGKLNGKETTLVVQMFGASKSSLVARKPVSVSPLPSPVLIARAEKTETPPLGVVKKPLINEFSVSKDFSLILMGGLLSVLTLDGFIIFKRRTVRIAGHNLAHFIFLLALMGVVLLTTSGAVL